MTARVDARALVVRDGATAIPFAVDCGIGAATLDPAGDAHRLRVLRWNEKCSLARFADAGPAFIERQFMAICSDGTIPDDPSRRAAAAALALWLHRSPALPLDPALLAGVTLRLSAALGVGPADLAALPAPEVEALWQAIEAQDTSSDSVDPKARIVPDDVTRIVIEPDPPERADGVPDGDPPTDPGQAVSRSMQPDPLEASAAAAGTESAAARLGSMPARDAPRPNDRPIPPSSQPDPRNMGGAAAKPEPAPARRGSRPAPDEDGPIEKAGAAARSDPARAPRGTRPATTHAELGKTADASAQAMGRGPSRGASAGTTVEDLLRPVSSDAQSMSRPAAPPAPPERPATAPSALSPRSGAGDDETATRISPPYPAAQPVARFRLVAGKAAVPNVATAGIPGMRRPPGRQPCARPRNASHAGDPRRNANGASVPDSSGRHPPEATRNHPDPPSAAPAAPAATDEFCSLPADVAARLAAFDGATIAGPDPLPRRAPEGIRHRHGPAGRGPGHAAILSNSGRSGPPAPKSHRSPIAAPETEAATALDSRLRALIEIVTRVSDAPADPDAKPEAMIEAFTERLAEAAAELGLAGGR